MPGSVYHYLQAGVEYTAGMASDNLSTDVALGVIGAVVLVQGLAGITLDAESPIWLVLSVGIYVSVTGFGVFLILWGLIGDHLKEHDFEIVNVSEPALVQAGSYLMLAGIAVSLIVTFLHFIVNSLIVFAGY